MIRTLENDVLPVEVPLIAADVEMVEPLSMTSVLLVIPATFNPIKVLRMVTWDK